MLKNAKLQMRNIIIDNRDMRILLKEGRLQNVLSADLENAVESVLSAFKSHIHPEGYAYFSTAITTGKRFYDVLEKNQVNTLEGLLAKGKNLLYDKVICPNIAAATVIAGKIAEKIKKTVIAPGMFEAKRQRWTQDAYMLLWYRVLEEMIDETIMANNWEYSNGQVAEFVRAYEIKFNFALAPRQVVSNLPVYSPRSFWTALSNKGPAVQYSDTMEIKDENLNAISLQEGAALIAHAVIDLERRRFNPEKLKQGLLEIGGLAECHEWYKDGWLGDYVSMPWKIEHEKVYDSIRMVWPSFRSCYEHQKSWPKPRSNRELWSEYYKRA